MSEAKYNFDEPVVLRPEACRGCRYGPQERPKAQELDRNNSDSEKVVVVRCLGETIMWSCRAETVLWTKDDTEQAIRAGGHEMGDIESLDDL